MRSAARRPWARFALVALLVALDLWSKAAVFEHLEHADLTVDRHGHPRLPLAGNWLAFMLSYNRGMAFGLADGYPYVLVGGRIVAALVLGWLLWRADPRRRLLTAAFVLVLAGALGNLYDNLFRASVGGHPFGAVRDFIDVYFGVWDYHFATFNVADSCITVGAVLLLFAGVGRAGDEPDEAGAEAEAGAAGGASEADAG